MSSRRPDRFFIRSGVFLVASVLVSLGATSAPRAQTMPKADASLDLQLFQTAMGVRPFLTLDSAHVLAHKQFALSLVSNYQNRPFSLYTVESGEARERTIDVVRHQAVSELTGAVGLGDWFQLGVAVPLTWAVSGDDFDARTGMPTGERLSANGIGDLRLEGKIKGVTFGPADEFLLSFAPGVTLPTGDASRFLGDKSVTGRMRAIAEFRLDDFRAAAMTGILLRRASESFAAQVGSQLMYAVAVDYRVHRDVGLIGELFGRSGLKEFTQRYVDANPVELDAGMRVALPQSMMLTVGGGIGLVKGIGSPRFRAVLGLAWSPDFRDRDGDGVYDHEDRCPDEPEDLDGYKDGDGCPDVDNDGDGVLDGQDRCPNEAEDIDQFQDEDGCPEPDNDNDGIADINDPCPNAAEDGRGKRPKDGCPSSSEDADGDGIMDARDKCPDEPEDRDGFEDYDGCPEPDNDGDNIPDQFDGCPNEAEDADGFEDADGCPDPDNDKDGIEDAQDKCPLEPETLNGNRDDDGCPDPGAEIVKLVDDRIEVRERISFAAGRKLTAGSQAVANLVAMVLRGHRDIARLRIEVFADGVSKDETQARADAIAQFLNGKGVEMTRLKPVGMGGGGNKIDFIVEQRAAKKAAGKE
jgi:outer membrane protein OmpA-like peptidoglycan-associated protein